MNEPNIKSGFKSSEFYLVIGNSIAGVAIALGYLTPQQADEFVKAVVAVLGGVMVIASTVAYIVGRIKLKQTAVQSGTTTPALPTQDLIEGLVGEQQGGMVYPK